jgi:uncharacterized membrane protein
MSKKLRFIATIAVGLIAVALILLGCVGLFQGFKAMFEDNMFGFYGAAFGGIFALLGVGLLFLAKSLWSNSNSK